MNKLQERFNKLDPKGLFDSEPLDDIDLDLKPLDPDPIDLPEDLQKALDLPPVDVDLKPFDIDLESIEPLDLEMSKRARVRTACSNRGHFRSEHPKQPKELSQTR